MKLYLWKSNYWNGWCIGTTTDQLSKDSMVYQVVDSEINPGTWVSRPQDFESLSEVGVDEVKDLSILYNKRKVIVDLDLVQYMNIVGESDDMILRDAYTHYEYAAPVIFSNVDLSDLSNSKKDIDIELISYLNETSKIFHSPNEWPLSFELNQYIDSSRRTQFHKINGIWWLTTDSFIKPN